MNRSDMAHRIPPCGVTCATCRAARFDRWALAVALCLFAAAGLWVAAGGQ